MDLQYKKTFEKKFDKFLPKIQHKVLNSILLFTKDPFQKILRNHALNGKWKGFRSIDAGGDLRVIFRELSNGSYELVEISDIGTHSQLY